MYDNEQGCYIPTEGEEKGLWFIDPATDNLYIVTNQDNGLMENVGPDDAIMDRINQLCRAGCDTNLERFAGALHQEFGLLPVNECLKRFDPESGYYPA